MVAASAEGAWITDVDGRRYLDCLAAYSAVNFGHRHPGLTAVAHAQLDRLTLTSRAFHSDQLGTFTSELADLAGKQMVLPMNTGAEAVESALKVARKWGVETKGVAADRATIVVAHGNFHGRTISIVSFSDDPVARGGFGPFTPGFRLVPYGDAGPSPTPSTRPPSRCCSSRSRARPASSYRRPTSCRGSARCAPSSRCC